MDEVHTIRDLYGADYVVLLVSCNCSGVGYYSINGNYAFNVTNIDYIPYYTFHHEIGHNSGL